MAIPSYFMQSTMIPKGLCEEIERMPRERGGLVFESYRITILVVDSKALWVQVWPIYKGLIPEHSNLNLNCSLGDMVLDDDYWHLPVRVDRIIWEETTTSSFFVKNAHEKIRENTGKFIESLGGSGNIHRIHRIKVHKELDYIWLVLKQRLLTNVERVWQGISHSLRCGVCRHIPEDLLHTIQDYLPAREIWNLLTPTDLLDASWSSNGTIKASISWAKHFMLADRGNTSSFQRPCSCPNMSRFGIYLNTDGSVRLEDGFATTRGKFHDNSGQWILGYNRFLGSCSVFEAELWGILDGLSILIDRGYKEVQIRTNSIEMASAIHEITLDGQTTALIRRICQLLSQI
ncbi:hypothetical protein Goari_005495 [Gossypium aridum]|uniref:RNase H type-1 domain-containing protein n=1 Tax=Gossypium aridum TaxID=34290 RepID=A0A7J8YQ21_GOSAI|nr:hypothetical protein [Gossypium aridum]